MQQLLGTLYVLLDGIRRFCMKGHEFNCIEMTFRRTVWDQANAIFQPISSKHSNCRPFNRKTQSLRVKLSFLRFPQTKIIQFAHKFRENCIQNGRVAQVLHLHVGHLVRAFSLSASVCVCVCACVRIHYTRNAHCGHAMHVPDVRTRVVCVSHVTFCSSPFHSYQQVDEYTHTCTGIHGRAPPSSPYTHIVRSLALCCVRFSRTDSINFFHGTQYFCWLCVCVWGFFSP